MASSRRDVLAVLAAAVLRRARRSPSNATDSAECPPIPATLNVVTLDVMGDIPAGEIHIRRRCDLLALDKPVPTPRRSSTAPARSPPCQSRYPLAFVEYHAPQHAARRQGILPGESRFRGSYKPRPMGGIVSLVEACQRRHHHRDQFRSQYSVACLMRRRVAGDARERSPWALLLRWWGPAPRKPTNFNDIKRVASQWFGTGGPVPGTGRSEWRCAASG